MLDLENFKEVAKKSGFIYQFSYDDSSFSYVELTCPDGEFKGQVIVCTCNIEAPFQIISVNISNRLNKKLPTFFISNEKF